MQTDLILTIAFIIFMSIFLLIKRKNVKAEMFIKADKKKEDDFKAKLKTAPFMEKIAAYIIAGPVFLIQKSFFLLRYDTEWGIKWMQRLGNVFSERWIKRIMKVLIVLSIIGMIVLIVTLGYTLYLELTAPEALPGAGGVALVLPFKTASQFYVPFMYWILSIIVLASVHEFAHGVIASAYGVKIRKTGFAFLCLFYIPLIPAAFVDIGEKWRKELPASKKMAIAGAGPISNVFTALFFFIILMFAITPYIEDKFISNGVRIDSVSEEGFASEHGMQAGEVIQWIDEYPIANHIGLTNAMKNTDGEIITVETDKGVYEGASTGKLGIWAENSFEKVSTFTAIIKWISGLFYYFVILNLGIGLMNLLPVSIFDGGIITESIVEKYSNKKMTRTIMGAVSLLFLGLIILLFIYK